MNLYQSVCFLKSLPEKLWIKSTERLRECWGEQVAETYTSRSGGCFATTDTAAVPSDLETAPRIWANTFRFAPFSNPMRISSLLAASPFIFRFDISVVSLPIPVPKCVNFRGWRWCSTLYCSWPYSLLRWIFELFDKLFPPFQLWYLQVNGLNFHLEPNTRKCLKEEIHKVPKNGIKCINLMLISFIVVNYDSW